MNVADADPTGPIGPERQAELAAALAQVHARIVTACERAGRSPETVALVAATKTRTPNEICALVAAADAAGIVLGGLGENRVQEAVAKQDALGGVAAPGLAGNLAVPWHLIGAIQTNKVKALVATNATPRFALLHGVDRPELVDALVRRRITSPILIEVNVSGDTTKAGCTPDDAVGLVRVAVAAGLDVRGLMTIAARDAADGGHASFARLRRMRDAAADAVGRALPELSMGMTDDLDAAIAEGATMVRVGRALFGPRPA